MKVKLRQRLAYRQARNTALIALFLGMALSAVQIGYDFFNEKKQFEATISQVTGLLEEAATEAVYNVDERLAEKVLNGLFVYGPIRDAQIVDDLLGIQLASKSRPPMTDRPGWLPRFLFGQDIKKVIPLYSGAKRKQVGQLKMAIDTYMVAKNFINRSILTLIAFIVFAFTLAGILALIFYSTLTRPLLRMSRHVSEVNPARPDQSLLEVPKGHKGDEMGILVETLNGLLQGFARSLENQRIAEEEARRNQEELFQAAKLVSVGTLVSGVAHEVNNPNTFILSNTYNMQKVWESLYPVLDKYHEKNGDFPVGNLSYSDIRDMVPMLLGGIQDGADRIKHIVASLKDFSRKEKDSGDYEPFQIDDVVKEAMNLVGQQIKKSTHHFTVEYGDGLPGVKGNFHQLEQVIINLIINACQALSGPSKAVRVATSSDPSSKQIIVTVQDEGVGMDPATQSRIFDPFFTTKSDTKGMGLGLSISERIITAHGGKMDFQSSPGRGTTVRLLLPACFGETVTNESEGKTEDG